MNPKSTNQQGKQLVDYEVGACLDFIHHYTNNYDIKNAHIFQKEITLAQSMSHQDKFTILFLNFGNNDFLTIFDKCLKNFQVQKLIAKKYLLLGWNISTDSQRALIQILQNTGLTDYTVFIDTATSAALIIGPNTDCLCITNVGLTEDDFLTILKEKVKYAIDPPPEMILEEGWDCKTVSDYEIRASSRFVDYTKNFNSTIEFQKDLTLEEALGEGRVVVPYLHFQHDGFLETFNECLSNSQVKKAITLNCSLIGWDLEQEQFHQPLSEALISNGLSKDDLVYFETRTTTVLVFVNGKGCAVLSDANLEATQFLNILAERIEENYVELLERKPTAEEFQQSMLDSFTAYGQRDYDNYEQDEHDTLKKKIGYALFGPPTKCKGYDDECEKHINSLYEVIRRENNGVVKHKDRIVIFNIFICTEPLDKEKEKRKKTDVIYRPEKDWSKKVVFVLRKCKHSEDPCRIFIDDLGRVYNSWDDYLNNNKMNECKMVCPKNGRYQQDKEHGNVILESHLSPACSIGSKIRRGVEIAGITIGALAMGGAAASATVVSAPAVAIGAAVAGGLSGAVSIASSSMNIDDKRKHKEDLSLTNSAARFDYLNIIAGSLGILGTASSTVLGQMVSRGFNVTQGAKYFINGINATNTIVFGANIANDVYSTVEAWIQDDIKPSPLAITQLSLSIVFFGHSLYNFQTVNMIIDERQVQILSEHENSLRSNRHRKTFTKLTKETYRLNNGELQKGRAEVIRFLTNVEDKDKIFAALTKSNKTMNKNGVKFSADNGQLMLNGTPVDMAQFAKMNKNDMNKFLSNLPTTSASEPITKAKLDFTDLCLKWSFPKINFDLDSEENILKVLNNPKKKVLSFIFCAGKQLIDELVSKYNFSDLIGQQGKTLEILQCVAEWINEKIGEKYKQYKKWQETQDPDLEEVYFHFLPMDRLKALNEIFQKIVDVICVDKKLSESSLEDLKQYFFVATANRFCSEINKEETIKKRKQKRKEYDGGSRVKTRCCICNGYYYEEK